MTAEALVGWKNWRTVFHVLIRHYGWSPQDFDALSIADLKWWHQLAVEQGKNG